VATANTVVVLEIDCQHCLLMSSRSIFHKKHCNCGHHHSKHNFGGGCTIVLNPAATRIGSNGEAIVFTEYCHCDRYDQTEAKVHVAKEKQDSNPALLAAACMDLAELEAQIHTTSELAEAQARVEVLRKKKKEVERREKKLPA
jgi:hypothetical protein